MADSASSSDFSSDEDDHTLPMGDAYAPSLAPRAVDVEMLDDAVDPEISDADAAFLTSLDPALGDAVAPVVTTDHCSYDAYTTALACLSSDAAPRALVAAIYRRFHRAFPLTPSMYRQYIGVVDALPQKRRLYEQATRDYWDVGLTIEHLQLLADYQDEFGDETWTTLSTAIDTALTTVGNDFAAGHDVWTTARELTTQHFDALDGDHDAAKETALRALYRRQMQRPLAQNDLAMSEFRAWNAYQTLAPSSDRDAAMCDAENFQQRVFGGAVYKKLHQFEARAAAALAGTPFGDATDAEAPEKVWTQYVRYAQFKLAPLMASPEDAEQYVVCLFERAVASVCLSSSLWSQYVEYVASHRPDDLVALTHRATRNVSFDSTVWVERLLAMEQSGASADEVTAMIETELLARTMPPLMDSAHMARTLTTYCGVVRRVAKDEDALDAAIARCKGFVEAVFPDDGSPVAALLTFQAQVLAFQVCSSGDASRQQQWLDVWREILRIRGGSADAWLSFYEEYRFTHAASATLVQELRDTVFTPAADQVQDYPLLILERWLAFELGVGDRQAYAHVRQRYQSLVQQMEQQTPAQAAAAAETQAPAKEKPASKKRKSETHAHAEANKKHKAEQQPAVTDTKKTERFTNDNTLFLCNVPKDATQDELHALFAHIPSLQDVRLVVKERGSHVKSRGMAYVQFRDDAGVAAGLLLHGSLVHGHPIKVDRSTPPSGSTAKAKPGAKTNDTKGTKATTTVYIGGLLPPEREPITEDQLKHALTEVLGDGAVTRVLILTDRRGRPKDYGLVEVADATLVNLAVQKQKELQSRLGDQLTAQTSRLTIDQVVRNRDEQKQATKKAKEARQPAKTERPQKPKASGGFQAKTAPHARPHARLASAASLMPRALRKKTASSDAAPASSSAAPDTAPKTNADFRRLFMS